MKSLAVITTLLTSAATLSTAQTGPLVFPEGSTEAFAKTEQNANLSLPISAFRDGKLDAETLEGGLSQSVWQTPATGTAELLASLRDQLTAKGYEVLFECQTRECGGFDFRFALQVVDEPLMHVDLGDFRYLTARLTGGERTDLIGLLVSRSPERGFVQITSISPGNVAEPIVSLSSKLGEATTDSTDAGLAEMLVNNGSAVLSGLSFGHGASGLDESASESLRDLADFLTGNPDQTVVLVGHTDASGSLEGNVALSRKRAASVVQRLIETYGVSPDQLSAEGVGYLAPRASNATEEGRNQNRRVEVVLTSAK